MNGWVPLTLAAKVAHRSTRTLRTWADNGHVGSACRVTDRRLLVWWPHVHDRTLSADRRLRNVS